jgi:hypothetical protein
VDFLFVGHVVSKVGRRRVDGGVCETGDGGSGEHLAELPRLSH